MIRKIKFSNFYSFAEEQEISFLAQKKKTYDYFESKSNEQITKIAGFIGGNASGKTNIMRVLSFFSYFVYQSSKNIDDKIAFKTFFNNKNVSSFYIEFEKDNFLFFYNFTIKENIILSEQLSLKKISKGSRKKEIFVRKKNSIDLNKDFFDGFPKNFSKNIRPDISLIAFIKSHYNVEIINILSDYFISFKTNINESGEINHLKHQFKTLELYLDDSTLKDEMNKIISSFDIGLSEIQIEKKVNSVNKKNFSISVHGVHNTKSKTNTLNLKYESSGTQSLFFTLANMLSALKNNHIVIIDEIETGLHPEAFNKILSYFIDENENGHAQLLFSSHSLSFMNKLDMHQIFLIEKDDNCQSNISRLNRVRNIRTDDNFLSKYMTGVYGAFPKIRI